ncbi:AraC family transcriptional regulator [Catellatospora methionotrophica]|uniref:AraC family transcriptional regulator n=1 Tax=Catellatospora methionotrophica TaxID=121620 RepID=A0A8J3LK38_9ACTN|nr:helix-turn-helix domain-containing protein [Catellatospora methionotrophica]GIG16656.1 AraC family transcriptional regulator [Catellatospora methionotrophica]
MGIAVKLDTRDLPPEHRFECWREMANREMAPTHVSSACSADFQASATRITAGDTCISVLEMPDLRSVRTQRLIQRSDPHDWALALVTDGVMGIDQDDAQARIEPGNFLLYDNSRPYDGAVLSSAARMVILHLPRELPIPGAALRGLLARPLPAQSGIGAVLAGYVDSLSAEASAMDSRHDTKLGTAAVDIATTYLAAQTDVTDELTPDIRRVGLLRQIKTHIAENIGDPRLSPAAVAASLHISVRYLHHLFREEELSIGQFIRRQRLMRCRADLTDPLLATRSAAAIGARWGFTDPSTFNRAFKQAFEQPPGEYRRTLYARQAEDLAVGPLL